MDIVSPALVRVVAETDYNFRAGDRQHPGENQTKQERSHISLLSELELHRRLCGLAISDKIRFSSWTVLAAKVTLKKRRLRRLRCPTARWKGISP